MSEINDFDNNTVPEITATEEAFDQFQANSAGEEGDYILLSDIVPAENTVEALEVPGSYDDGLIDGTEVNSVEYLYEPKVEAANGYDAGEAVTLSDLSERLTLGNADHDFDARSEEIHPEISSLTPTEQSLPRKRGRKPKKRFDNSQDLSVDLNQTKPKSTGRGRRGRKPKNSQPVVSHIDLDKKTNGTEMSPNLTEPPKKVLRTARSSVQREPTENKKEELVVAAPKKRGRKKKIKPEVNLTSDNFQNNEEADISTMSTMEDLGETVVPTPKKRGRKKKINLDENKSPGNDQLQNQEELTPDISIEQDDADDICLSKLKKNISSTNETQSITDTGDRPLDDFEYNPDKATLETSNVVVESVADIHSNFKINVDSVASESIDNKPVSVVEPNDPSETIEVTVEPAIDNNALLVEDNTKRPKRRNARKAMRYEVDSDADPFADVSSTDDEDYGTKKRKKSRRKSDDEFIPGGKYSSDESAQDDWDEDLNNLLTMSRKKSVQKTGKRGRPRKSSILSTNPVQPDTTVQSDTKPVNSDDIEECLESSVIKGGNSNLKPDSNVKKNSMELANKEFENFLNRRMIGSEGLKIKKVSLKETSTPTVVPLEIPTIDPTETKTVHISTQTSTKETKAAFAQTSSPYSIKMTSTIELSSRQTDNACEFLKGILKTTSELGTLMTEKSEEFIQKKVNNEYVKDTMKVDYCIKKAFLLFKLAKDNLTTMEENLEKQYEDFLKANDLANSIQTEKKLAPKPPETNSDSDCEIVGETIPSKLAPKAAPKFNPKTVFLNKELSIKIAKKPSASSATTKKTMNMKGRHAVWINDAVMVKKVKGQPSFLAQDSRNKKPPDHTPKKITEQMVKSFFEQRYRTQAMRICRLYTTPQWIEVSTAVTCNYFFINKEDESCSSHAANQPIAMDITSDNTIQKLDFAEPTNMKANAVPDIPQSLFSICIQVLQKTMYSTVPQSPRVSVCKDPNTYGTQNNVKQFTLFDLCAKSICNNRQFQCGEIAAVHPKAESYSKRHNTAECLKTLCYKRVTALISENIHYEQSMVQEDENSIEDHIHVDWSFLLEEGTCLAQTASEILSEDSSIIKPSKTDILESVIKHKNGICKPPKLAAINTLDSLKKIAFDNIKQLLFGDQLICQKTKITELDEVHNVEQLSKLCFMVISKYFATESRNDNDSIPVNALTIGTVNTLSDEAFWNMDETSNDSQYAENDAFCNDYEDATETREDECSEPDTWESRVQLQELKSGIINTLLEHPQEEPAEQSLQEPAQVHIKQEALDDHSECAEPVNIKIEPEDHHSGMVNIPSDMEHIITKGELQDYTEGTMNPLADGAATDVPAEAFEDFVRHNKMIRSISYDEGEEGHSVFSQSGLRVRRQFVPDSYNDYEIDMDLLVPQQAEPLTELVAKDTLMESSSDDDNAKQKLDKKQEKRKKGRPKKISNQSIPVKNIVEKPPQQLNKPEKPPEKPGPASKKAEKQKPAPVTISEVAILTRRMRERIRNEENKEDSSNSDNEELASLSDKINSKKKSAKTKKLNEKEIQCSNVDSTEQIRENLVIQRPPSDDMEDTTFSGFSPVDQNIVSRYQKYLNDVYEKILPDETNGGESIEVQNGVCFPSTERSSPPLVGDEPVELLECEPTMPIYDRPKPRSKKMKKTDKHENPNYIDRHGWKCYPMDGKDTKLYKSVPYVGLDKLPEVFVQTYFQYLNVTEKSKEDAEVERLTNLQSLHKPQTSLSQSSKGKVRPKDRSDGQQPGQTTAAGSARASPDNSDYNELAPSDDEVARVEDELPSPAPKQTADNCLAKNLLMNDNESDTETNPEKSSRVNKEPEDGSVKLPKPSTSNQRMRGRAAPVKVFSTPEAIVLTADKMMKTELSMLNAPIVPGDAGENVEQEPKETKYSPPKEASVKPKEKHLPRRSTRRERSNPDDSSSEEEKQWVSTKEKLLKRMEKKIQEDTTHADAKRTKIVNEFIEKQASKPAAKPTRGRGRRSKKKFLERQKQLKVLSNELYGDAAAFTGKKSAGVAYAKGRRNIRKVIDKKSLARSTVIANMEEFERKRRLNMKQTRLKELLGYEEGVNVLVINDEVCLEYDFEDLQPVVSVHPFFTKVMKAHQYEGVKFMWDACFESLEMVESGSGGGGCILAHCMGLGKTLQVLALLHTVLTHPRVRMQRVLVCCPLSTVLNWVDEIHKWLGPVTDQIKVFELSKLKKTYERAYQLEDWYNGGGIFIIGYELFRSLSTLDPALDDVRPKIIKKIRSALLDPGPDIIVCDEGHLLKNDSSVLAISMSRVKTRRRIILTGTPMQNNLREYYCMVDFVKPNLLGTYFEYSNRFENPIMNGQHRDSREEDIRLMKARTHILHRVLEGCLQRQEASVLYPYLPKKHEYTVFISLSKCQSDLYRHYLSAYKARSSLSNSNKSSLLKDYNILQKIWSHPRVLHNFQTRQRDSQVLKAERLAAEDDLARADLTADVDVKPAVADMKPDVADAWWLDHTDGGNAFESLESSNKFVTVFKILKECVELGDKLLIFSTSLFTMDALEYFLQSINGWSLGQEYYRLDGSVPPEVRQKWCREFNAEHNVKTKLFLISTRAGCLGLNMTAANRVIILDTSWNPAHDIQSIFRVYRFGQKKDCYIYRLVAMGTMEQKIYERSVTKQAVACRVVDEQQIDRHYNMGELAELYRLDEAGEGVSCGVAVGVRDVVLLRVARDTRALHAVHEHDSLLRDTRDDLPEHERAAAWHQFQQEQQTLDQLSMSAMAPAMTIPKVASKRSLGQDTRTSVRTCGPSTSSTPAQPTTSTAAITAPSVKLEERNDPPAPASGPRSKKRRKGMITCDIPVRKPTEEPPPQPLPKPSSPISILPDSADPQSQTIIAKITAALQKHNFKSTDGSLQPAALAKMVSSIISNVNVEVTAANTDIAASVVDAVEAPDPQPASEDTSANESATRRGRPPKRRRPGRPKKVQSSGDTAAAAPAPPAAPEVQVSPRTKRQAAITAGLKIETGKESPWIISLDDDSDAEYFPDDDCRYSDAEPEKPAAPIPVSTKHLTPKPKQQPQPTTSQADDSILLSDDESPNKSSSDGVIPLHTSLLSNKNFIKIVAHTYLKGNPMMDEDAATLAAEYSTSKALKEVQSTGKSIDSGPIYDIAKKVLGIDVLKKLHEADSKKNAATKPSENKPQISAAAPATKAIKIKPKPLSKMTKPQETTKLTPLPLSKMVAPPTDQSTKKSIPKITIKNSSLLKPMEVMDALKQEIVPPLSNTDLTVYPGVSPAARNASGVVPVGIVKRVESAALTDGFAQHQEESILPDDDDEVRFVNDPPPPPPPPPSTLIPSNVMDILARKRKQTFSSSSKSTAKDTPIVKIRQPTVQRTLTLESGVVVALQEVKTVPENAKIIKLQRKMLPNMMASATAPVAPPPPAEQSTICLDSDEEDAPTIVSGPIPTIVSGPIPAGQPTPVSLHSAATAKGRAGAVYPVTVTSAPVTRHQQGTRLQIEQQQLAQQQTTQLPTDQQPQMVQLNLQGSFTPDELGQQLQTMFGSHNNIVLMPRTALQGGGGPIVFGGGNSYSALSKVPISVDNIATEVQAQPEVSSKRLKKIGIPALKPTPAPSQPEVSAKGQKKVAIPALKPPSAPASEPQPDVSAKRQKKVAIPALEPAPAPAPPAAEAPAKAPKSSKEGSLNNKPAKTATKVTPQKEPSPPPKPWRISSSSSSSDSSRSASPEPEPEPEPDAADPMSLFKNVVHIQAPGEAAPADVAPRTHRKTRAGPLSKTVASSNKTNSESTLATVTSKSKPSQPLRLLASFDLTETKNKSTSSKNPPKILNATLDKPSTISGTSKNIIIGGANKSLSKVSPSKKTAEASSSQSTSRVVHITNMKTVSPATKPQEAKRKAPPAAPAPVPKKPKKPTRLEDFCLDDIEDIIELE